MKKSASSLIITGALAFVAGGADCVGSGPACKVVSSPRNAVRNALAANAHAGPTGTRSPDYVVPAWFPVVELQDDASLNHVTATAVRTNTEVSLIEITHKDPHVVYARSDEAPDTVVVHGSSNASLHARLLLPDGTTREPVTRTATDDGVSFHFAPVRLPPAALPPIRLGVYYVPYLVNDSTMIPSAAWMFHPRPEQVAAYDFSVIEMHSAYGTPTRDFVDEVLRRNPAHRVILRLEPIPGAMAQYFWSDIYRRGLVDHYADAIERLGPKNLHAVTIGEEENGGFLGELWRADGANETESAVLLLAEYARETRRAVTWHDVRAGDSRFFAWLKPKVQFFYSDLYARLKARFPDLRVLQYLALSNDRSGIGFSDPSEIPADGWVYWNFNNDHRPTLVPVRLADGREVQVEMHLDSTLAELLRLRTAGVPNDEIYHCGFANEPLGVLPADADQVRALRELGFPNIFLFHPVGAFLEPEDADEAHRAEIDVEPYVSWRARRRALLNLVRK